MDFLWTCSLPATTRLARTDSALRLRNSSTFSKKDFLVGRAVRGTVENRTSSSSVISLNSDSVVSCDAELVLDASESCWLGDGQVGPMMVAAESGGTSSWPWTANWCIMMTPMARFEGWKPNQTHNQKKKTTSSKNSSRNDVMY
jgi:hypothetical protein